MSPDSRIGASRLERLRKAWDRRPEHVPDCPHEHGSTLFRQINANGSSSVYLGCVTCRQPLRPGHFEQINGTDLNELPVVSDRRTQNPPCAVCGEWGTELHHWAPRSLFGIEASHWPTSFLCVGCHAEWHKRIRDTLNLDLTSSYAGRPFE